MVFIALCFFTVKGIKVYFTNDFKTIQFFDFRFTKHCFLYWFFLFCFNCFFDFYFCFERKKFIYLFCFNSPFGFYLFKIKL
ncbi:hypothetical protein Barb6XT_02925 [Bacteroidales bacterium Barb6XT]|nr:hypothetical protein Barb6XT_02925 [Bacteroidales bacterium Barb6XT]